jgi:hypothetical protein
MQQIEVKPPATAARAPDSIVSLYSAGLSQMDVEIRNPGATIMPWASKTSSKSLVFIGFADQFDQPVADDDVASRFQPLRRVDDSAVSNQK